MTRIKIDTNISILRFTDNENEASSAIKALQQQLPTYDRNDFEYVLTSLDNMLSPDEPDWKCNAIKRLIEEVRTQM